MILILGIILHYFVVITVLPPVCINIINILFNCIKLICVYTFILGTRDWQNAAIGPKQGNLLCFECRSYNKKYGELPPTPQSPAECPSPATSDITVNAESPSRMRTRNKSKETVS